MPRIRDVLLLLTSFALSQAQNVTLLNLLSVSLFEVEFEDMMLKQYAETGSTSTYPICHQVGTGPPGSWLHHDNSEHSRKDQLSTGTVHIQ